jgi:hypothetical protein
MTDAVDAFVATVSRGIRRSIYQRLRDLRDRRLGEGELNAIVATATRAALDRAGVRDLASLSMGGAQVATALQATVAEGDPLPPELAAWLAARDAASPGIVDALFQVGP